MSRWKLQLCEWRAGSGSVLWAALRRWSSEMTSLMTVSSSYRRIFTVWCFFFDFIGCQTSSVWFMTQLKQDGEIIHLSLFPWEKAEEAWLWPLKCLFAADRLRFDAADAFQSAPKQYSSREVSYDEHFQSPAVSLPVLKQTKQTQLESMFVLLAVASSATGYILQFIWKPVFAYRASLKKKRKHVCRLQQSAAGWRVGAALRIQAGTATIKHSLLQLASAATEQS